MFLLAAITRLARSVTSMTGKRPPARLRKAAQEPSTSPKKGPARALRLSGIKPIAKTGPQASDPAAPVLIVLGYDDQGKPRAARFTGGDPALIEKAAAAMNLEVRPVTSPDGIKPGACGSCRTTTWLFRRVRHAGRHCHSGARALAVCDADRRAGLPQSPRAERADDGPSASPT
jgi:hypothetical protein